MQIPEERLKHAESLPEVTLSAFTETGHTGSSILVPKQRSYIGRYPVIPSSLANTRCADLGAEGVLEKLNTTLGTAYTLDAPCLSSLLEDYIAKDYDFGTAYARLRPIWYNNLTTVVEEKLRTHETWDREMRRKVLVGNRIISTIMPPRRVWDLYSNRVVPWHFVRRQPYPISHAWMEETDRDDVLTPINGREWPTPIPKDANLDLIRIEMLNIHRCGICVVGCSLFETGGWEEGGSAFGRVEGRRAHHWMCISEDPGGVLLQRVGPAFEFEGR